MFVDLYQRAAASYEVAISAYSERTEYGLQPSTPFIDLFNVDIQEKLLSAGSLTYIIIAISLYLHMQARNKPYKIKKLMMLYNIVNVLLSLYVASGIITLKLRSTGGLDRLLREGLVCTRLDTSPEGHQMAHLFVVFFLQKFLEFLDTLFFVLRRSFRQVTFLHLFHHSSITVIVGSVLPFSFSDDMYLPILMNSMTHVLLYTHYILTGLGMHAWWSKYLTSLQLGQFALIFLQSCVTLYMGPDCGSPDFVKVLLIIYMGSMLLLFGVFFTQKYILKMDAADMCGVIKSIEPSGNGVAASWHGNVKLDEKGGGQVYLPKSFHTSPEHKMYCYQLTPIGLPMPSLHVSGEISPMMGGYRFSISGGESRCLVSWQVASIQVDDRVPN